MEYLYIAGIIAYYVYKAYANNKKKQQEKAETIPSAQKSTAPKKKKGFFDDFLEELEKQNQAPTTKQKEETVVVAPTTRPNQREERAINKTPQKIKQAKAKPAPVYAEDIAKPINKYFEIPKSELDVEIANTDIEAILQGADQPKERKTFAGMDISPKQALKSQIILERRF